ncbi:alanine racemase [Hyphomonas sp.]|uniref:alanine racemase n=1 Tax=Hyphomonas sp. TaxID=87 RepID=UPI0032D93833
MSSRPRAHVHLSSIAANWQAIDRLNPTATTAAVVKADGYGLGAAKVSRTLARAGCSTFFVAHFEEGTALRQALGFGPRIFVLNGPTGSHLRTYREADLTPVLSSEEQVELWARAPRGACALHFDTGMNRLGLSSSVLTHRRDELHRLQPVLIMSHLACGDLPDHALNRVQLDRFTEIASAFPDTPASLSASSGCYLGKAYAFDLTRPGIALYGGSTPPETVRLEPTVTLEARILSVFTAKAGETVGYAATHTLEQNTTLATVALGYADGIPRSGGNALIGYLDGTPCPVLGRISMDLITIDVSKAQAEAKSGARVEFLGAHAKLEEQAARAGTLGYELLTGLSNRVERVYP